MLLSPMACRRSASFFKAMLIGKCYIRLSRALPCLISRQQSAHHLIDCTSLPLQGDTGSVRSSRMASVTACQTIKVANGASSDHRGCPDDQQTTATGQSYEDAIAALNSLQSNAQVIEIARRQRSSNAMRNITNTSHYLKLCNISDKEINELNIIHIAGTKGKGSTAAFTESVLRSHGYRTGFYSSPHLIAARERIRINGEPLSRKAFTTHFWQVYNQLRHHSAESASLGIPDLPPYFMFLTVLAFKVFVDHKVDGAIIEVGIGGEYDCTNMIKEPKVVGITSLGIDHTAILGNTIDRIAWQKSGIFKKNVPAFTVDQEEDALVVLKNRAVEKQCPLAIAPSFDKYAVLNTPISLGIPGDVQKLNASLALQLSHTWMELKERNNNFQSQNQDEDSELKPASTFPIDERSLKGLTSCNWPGRYQTLRRGNITYFLDGAHTSESIQTCKEWFHKASRSQPRNGGSEPYRILLFNCTGQRDAHNLLSPLIAEEFDATAFSTNNARDTKVVASDQSNFNVDPVQELENVNLLRGTWLEMFEKAHGRVNKTASFSCLSDVIDWIKSEPSFAGKDIQVLVTGSLHLVGGVLGLIDPELESFHSN